LDENSLLNKYISIFLKNNNYSIQNNNTDQ